LENGHLISRLCDIIFYSVEAENLAKVVKLFGNSTKVGAIVAGQVLQTLYFIIILY
jgi:prephenate dehydrogenase (NADP+)